MYLPGLRTTQSQSGWNVPPRVTYHPESVWLECTSQDFVQSSSAVKGFRVSPVGAHGVWCVYEERVLPVGMSWCRVEEIASSHACNRAFARELSTWSDCFGRAVQSQSYSPSQPPMLTRRAMRQHPPCKYSAYFRLSNKLEYLCIPVHSSLDLVQPKPEPGLQHCSSADKQRLKGFSHCVTHCRFLG